MWHACDIRARAPGENQNGRGVHLAENSPGPVADVWSSPLSVVHAVCSAGGLSTLSYSQVHDVAANVNLPPIPSHATFAAVPNGGLPLAPSLTQSPWLANTPSTFHPPCWQRFAVSLLPPLAAKAGPAPTMLTATANAPMTTKPLRRCIAHPPRRLRADCARRA